MLTPPAGLSDDTLRAVLDRGWGIEAASMRYRPVGFGSHHWEVLDDTSGRRWVTVDELGRARQTRGERDDAAADRLRAALQAAVDLRAIGCAFVVAPVLTLEGNPFVLAEGAFAVAVYPFVDGETFAWGTFTSTAHRRAVLDLIIAVHTAPATAARHAIVDDFAIRSRGDLERGMMSLAGGDSHAGPYGRVASTLLIENAARIRRVLRRYDDLVDATRGDLGPMVLTHGEPHAGNTIRTPDGWCLVDWDTALVAAPERDLWSLETGDGSVIDAYRDATGVTPRAAMLDLYRVRWDLADIAGYVTRFAAHHEGTADDDKSWDELCTLIGHLPE